jgi:hypothetical protein
MFNSEFEYRGNSFLITVEKDRECSGYSWKVELDGKILRFAFMEAGLPPSRDRALASARQWVRVNCK